MNNEKREPTLDLHKLPTEQRNPRTLHIDEMSTLDMVTAIQKEDACVAAAVETQLPAIAKAVDLISERMGESGRMIYVGCGTSGRLGILDAAECVPTFNAEPWRVVGIIAGGEKALIHAVEGAEDDREQGRLDAEKLQLTSCDTVIGLAASGRTPYVLGALEAAKSRGIACIAVTCAPSSPIGQMADVEIAPAVGPEVITGSTRMKCGTAQKMILNMLSTAVMIRRGKVYENLMIDVRPTNEKLVRRAVSIVSMASGAKEAQAEATLKVCEGDIRTAILMLKKNLGREEAKERLSAHAGNLTAAMKE